MEPVIHTQEDAQLQREAEELVAHFITTHCGRLVKTIFRGVEQVRQRRGKVFFTIHLEDMDMLRSVAACTTAQEINALIDEDRFCMGYIPVANITSDVEQPFRQRIQAAPFSSIFFLFLVWVQFSNGQKRSFQRLLEIHDLDDYVEHILQPN